jgi:phage recombination protein Bet
MGTLATLPDRLQIGKLSYTSQQLDLIRKTAAKDCNDVEFSQFIHVCGSLQLDPMRKQIYALVYNKNKADKRQMTIIIGVGGYRSVASRSGNYRPDTKPPRFTLDETLISPKNPKGIVKCEVSVFLFSHGSWFEVPHEVMWDAYAPVEKGGEYVDTGGKWPDGNPKQKFKPDGKDVLSTDGRWPLDPFGMISKCAEVGAIRKAFPDDFSGVYEQAEMDKQVVDLTAAEYAEAAAIENRLAIIGGKDSILFDFMDGQELRPVPLGKVHAECEAFLKANPDPDDIQYWQDRNKHSLQDFWARAKNDALDIKDKIEKLKAAKVQA